MKALVDAFNREKALVGAFFVIVQPVVEPMDLFTALFVISDGFPDSCPIEGGLNLASMGLPKVTMFRIEELYSSLISLTAVLGLVTPLFVS